MAEIVDFYSSSNADSNDGLNTSITSRGQAFEVSTSCNLYSAHFFLYTTGAKTGNAYANLYQSSGTYGSAAKPANNGANPLATSDAFDVSTLTGSSGTPTDVEFLFSGAEAVSMSTGEYIITFRHASTGSISVNGRSDASTPSHGGNETALNAGNWSALSTKDFCFYVYGTASTSALVSSINTIFQNCNF